MLLLIIILELSYSSMVAQSFPMNNKTGKIVYTDIVKYDTLNADTAFYKILENFQESSKYFVNLEYDTTLLTINCTYRIPAFVNFPDHYGKIEYDIYIKCLPNKTGYRLTNFRHILLNKEQYVNNLELERPKYFDSSKYRYWKTIKIEAMTSINDLVLTIIFVPIRNEWEERTVQYDDYFLLKNRK